MSRPRHLVVVVGTGTEVGKTWVSCRLLEHWRAVGRQVAARKPVQSFDPADLAPTDARALAGASGEQPDSVCPARRSYPVAVAPPMAARRVGAPVPTLAELVDEIAWPEHAVDVGLVETAGGLRSPQASDGCALDLAGALGPDLVVVVADAGLGTISAVRLAAEALDRRELPFVVVLNRYDESDALHAENLAWLRDTDGLDTVGGRGAVAYVAERAVAEPAVAERAVAEHAAAGRPVAGRTVAGPVDVRG